MAVNVLLKNVTAAQTVAKVANPNSIAQPVSLSSPNSPASSHAFQVVIRGNVGATAAVQFVGSNDGVNWDNYGSTVSATVTVSDGTPGNKSGSGIIPFAYVGAFVSSISGTNASCDATVSA